MGKKRIRWLIKHMTGPRNEFKNLYIKYLKTYFEEYWNPSIKTESVPGLKTKMKLCQDPSNRLNDDA